ncbi:putative E3 ubiquitin-protein ligase ARI11 [Arabidopsis thaliana]
MDYSDDDMIDNESGEENNSDGGGNESYNYNAAVDTIILSEKGYVIIKEEEILKLQRDDIERVSTILFLSQVEAIVLLLHYHWCVSKLEDEWFTDEERIRKTVGILKEPVVDVNGTEVDIQCGICFESYTRKEIARVSCGHPYCKTCWTGYITTKIEDGPGCLRVKCPEPSCYAVVGQDMIDEVTEKKDKDKRVLKWTYAYGYYLDNLAKRPLFEYLQGEAETGLERLHHCAENELKQFFIKSEDPSDTFNAFRIKLTGLTKVTKTYFDNLVKALENGLADVTKSSEESADFLETQKLYDAYISEGCFF